jgi:hypothetical protein
MVVEFGDEPQDSEFLGGPQPIKGDIRLDDNVLDYTHSNNGRQRTTFRTDKLKGDKYWKFQRLWYYQNDYSVPDRKYYGTDNRGEKDKKAVVEAYAGQLEVPKHVYTRAKSIAKCVDGRRFNRIGGIRAIALGAIVIAQNEQLEDYSHRIQVWERDNERILSELANKEDIDLSQSTSLIKSDNGYYAQN